VHRYLINRDSCLKDYAGWCDKLEVESFPADNGFMKVVRWCPIGVVGINCLLTPESVLCLCFLI
jgi:hypothetical protein